ncbi:ROK family transcriptional regulator [Chelatococcus asaccharovorans]|uniref:ROK family transcriptional regulator n=1 Tax=Chelatococcus asaccharovorans TaxID=28210 RepID=UPI00224C6478|nr:ROK family transcriptional regulator [Chelatococcus asaccharovorans]CAH1665195.1 putative NBD/HSP70 family sugar kinase [Chelatococcus asaccharovorans]CAH1682070.1 putative NBD/HSP70 family sugar kinase [Chelatococcus asaccharovorans]
MHLSFNERQVLELVFLGTAVSRVEMAQTLGLTGASITRIVSRLMDEGLIDESSEKSGQQGQPRRNLSIVAGRRLSAGVNFSRKQVQLALIDLAGHVVGVENSPITEPHAKQIVAATRRGLAKLLDENARTRADLVGFGVSVPGNFGRNSRDFRAHELFPQIEGLSFADDLVALFDAPVFFENDGACAVLGEYMFGAGRGTNHVFLIHVGHGVGGGGIVEGRLFKGANGNACLPGAIYPIGAARPSGQDLLDHLAEQGLPDIELTDDDLNGGEARPFINAWINRAGEQLGRTAQIISGLFDPTMILIGGRLPRWINEGLSDRAGEFIGKNPGPSRGLKTVGLVPSKLGQCSGSVGAASLPLFANYFAGAVNDTFSNYRNGWRGNTNSLRR